MLSLESFNVACLALNSKHGSYAIGVDIVHICEKPCLVKIQLLMLFIGVIGLQQFIIN